MDSLDPSHEPAWRENHEKNNHDAGDHGDHGDGDYGDGGAMMEAFDIW